MSQLPFVSQSGTRTVDVPTRRLIRRHVMLGKNLNRPARNPKQPTLQGTSVFSVHSDSHPAQHQQPPPPPPPVPRRVGSDLSALRFADAVDDVLLHETLQFCSVTNQSLYLLEPCISFDSHDTVATCLQPLACDALYLHVMVFTTQIYMDKSFRQHTSTRRRTDGKGILVHYGKALNILKDRVAVVGNATSGISHMTIMAVLLLALHSLVIGDGLNARNHVLGLSRMVNLQLGGIHSLRTMTKATIEVLRCDLSVSLATGQMPLFFQHTVIEPYIPLPELSKGNITLQQPVPITNLELIGVWRTLLTFCTLVNHLKASRNDRPNNKISEVVFLDTMAATMYRLINIGPQPTPIEEATRLATLAFTTNTFLQWRDLHLPLPWLLSQLKSSIGRLLQSHTVFSHHPAAFIWVLTMYGLSLPPPSGSSSLDHEILQTWLLDATKSCGWTCWEDVRAGLAGHLWIDSLCNQPAQKMFQSVFTR